MQDAPRLLKIVPHQTIGFYDLISSQQCILRGSKKNIVVTGSLPDEPPSRSTLVGRFYHEIMEFAVKVRSIEQLELDIENSVQKYSVEIQNYSHFNKAGSFSGWPEVNRAVRRAYDLHRSRGSSEHLDTLDGGPEKTLVSADKKFIGRPDYYVVTNTQAKIVELKSTAIRDSQGKTKDEYAKQVLFYAGLIFDNYNVTKVEANLESISGDSETFKVSRTDAQAARARDLGLLSQINQTIENAVRTSDLETPSDEACSYCGKRILCERFKAEQLKLRLQGTRNVIEGSVLDIKIGTPVRLTVQDENLGILIEVQLPSDTLFKDKGRFAFTELERTPSGFRASSLTQVYKLNE